VCGFRIINHITYTDSWQFTSFYAVTETDIPERISVDLRFDLRIVVNNVNLSYLDRAILNVNSTCLRDVFAEFQVPGLIREVDVHPDIIAVVKVG
jgi:hypothetical protein